MHDCKLYCTNINEVKGSKPILQLYDSVAQLIAFDRRAQVQVKLLYALQRQHNKCWGPRIEPDADHRD